ncbi:MAG: hypothetical protein QXZ13_01620, partial [Candidatus Diapherotrites archaeon]
VLKELGFYDSVKKPLTEKTLDLLSNNFSAIQENEFTLECLDQDFITSLGEKLGLKPRGQQMTITKTSLPNVIEFILNKKNVLEKNSIKIFSSTMKAEITKDAITITGSFNDLNSWRTSE